MSADFRTLIEWLHVTDLSLAQLDEVKSLVDAARKSLAADDPRQTDLGACSEILWDGLIPGEALTKLLEKWQQTAGLESQTDTARVASEIRLIASSLPEFEWLTSSYQEALDACDDFDDGDTESLFEWTGEFSDKLEESWHRYTGLSVVSSEVTAETAVSHALLLEGIQGWYDAVDMLVQAADGDQDFEPALDRAEEANRLLVAVQKYSDRLHREVQATAK